MVAFDPRHLNYEGDGWICTGITDGTPCAIVSASGHYNRPVRASIRHIQRSGLTSFHSVSGSSAVIRISDIRGKTIRKWIALESCTLDAPELSAGTHVAVVSIAEQNKIIRLPLAEKTR